MRRFHLYLIGIIVILLNGCQAQLPDLKNASSQYLQYPTTVALTYEDSYPFCSGVFVENDLVITAAHCIRHRPGEPIFIVYNYDRPRFAKYDGKLHRAVKIRMHPESDRFFYPGVPGNDLALLLLADPALHIKLAHPASQEEVETQVPVNTIVEVAGFGLRDGHDSNSGNVFHIIELPIQKIEPTQILAGNENTQNSCYGDSGGPLLDQNGDVVAITSRSRGVPPCFVGSIYTLLYPYQDWIQKTYSEMKIEYKSENN